MKPLQKHLYIFNALCIKDLQFFSINEGIESNDNTYGSVPHMGVSTIIGNIQCLKIMYHLHLNCKGLSLFPV